jgi:hypothetical protein
METRERSSQVAVEAGIPVQGGAERRRDERYAVHGDAEILVTGGMSMFRGRIVNISCSGCYVQTVAWVRLPPRTPVELVFVVKGHAVRARAEACYSESKIGLGLRFVVMEESMQRRLDSVLAGLRRDLLSEKVEEGKAERSALDVLTATAAARTDAALKSTEAAGGEGSAERAGEAREEDDARFADLEELGLAREGELSPEDADAIAAMEAVEAAGSGVAGAATVGASGGGAAVVGSGGEAKAGAATVAGVGGEAKASREPRREPEGVLERPASPR